MIRTPANNSEALAEAVETLVGLGLSREEAIRVGFGRFPVAGVARYTHDWLFPRYGPGFRFHHGTDVVAPFGTPLRAVVDGTVTASTSELGGLSAKVFDPDGTYYYYAHMSALVDGFTSGMTVETGDIIGYVGDSGNARGGVPHVHFGIYPKGGGPVDPKPVLDQFLADAANQLPTIVEQLMARQSSPAASATETVTRTPRSLLATSLLRTRTDATEAAQVSTEILYQATADPTAGGASVAQAEANNLAAAIDWESRRTDRQARP